MATTRERALPVPDDWLPAGIDPATARVLGVDEVGRGALAGPLVVGGAILPAGIELHPDLRDSKALDPKGPRIARVAAWVLEVGEVWIEEVSAAEIDRLGIGVANKLAMARVCERAAPDLALIDGPIAPVVACPVRAVVRGERYAPVAAASIVAKVYRDTIMRALDAVFPGYAFASSVGYGLHAIEGLRSMGRPSPIHRRSFRVKVLEELVVELVEADVTLDIES